MFHRTHLDCLLGGHAIEAGDVVRGKKNKWENKGASWVEKKELFCPQEPQDSGLAGAHSSACFHTKQCGLASNQPQRDQ